MSRTLLNPMLGILGLLSAVSILLGCASETPPTPYITSSGTLLPYRGSDFDDIFLAAPDIEVRASHSAHASVVFRLRRGELFYAHHESCTPIVIHKKAPAIKAGKIVSYMNSHGIPDGDVDVFWHRGQLYSIESWSGSDFAFTDPVRGKPRPIN